MNHTPLKSVPYILTLLGWLTVCENDPIDYELTEFDGLDMRVDSAG